MLSQEYNHYLKFFIHTLGEMAGGTRTGYGVLGVEYSWFKNSGGSNVLRYHVPGSNNLGIKILEPDQSRSR